MRITALLLVAAMAILMMSGTAFAAIEGAGTETDPFIISTVEDLTGFKEHYEDIYDTYYPDFEARFGVKGPFYKLSESAAEFDLSGEEWVPVGTYSEPFIGSFNGNGVLIRNFELSKAEADYAGFFGAAEESVISNLNFKDANVTGNENVGILAGGTYNTNVYLCSVINGSVTASGNNAGGLIGNTSYAAALSGDDFYFGENYFTGAVRSGNNAGGFIGVLSAANIDGLSSEGFIVSNLIFNGSVFSREDAAGGLIGSFFVSDVLYSSFVMNSVNGSVLSGGGKAGGFIGSLDLSGEDVEIYWNSSAVNGTMTSSGDDAGGLFGTVAVLSDKSYLNVTNAYIEASVTAGNNSGGVAGSVTHQNAGSAMEVEFTVSDLYLETDVMAENNHAGGLFGYLFLEDSKTDDSGFNIIEISDIYSYHSQVSAANYSGGLAGFCQLNKGHLGVRSAALYENKIKSSADFSGGLVGSVLSENGTFSVDDATLKSMEVESGENYAGGAVGSAAFDQYGGSDLYSVQFDGSVKAGDDYAGGGVGYLKLLNGTYSNLCHLFLKGTVSGDDCTGGLAGRVEFGDDSGFSGDPLDYGSIDITHNYFVGDVSGAGQTGGFIGDIDGSNAEEMDFDIFESYFIGNVTGFDNAGGFIGRNNKGAVADSYAAALIRSEGSSVGAFVGDDSADDYSNCFALSGSASDISGITFVSDSDLKNPDTFTSWEFLDLANFGPDSAEISGGIIEIWVLANGCFYPQLSCQNAYHQEPIEINSPEDLLMIGAGNLSDSGKFFITETGSGKQIWLGNVDYILMTDLDMAGHDFKPILGFPVSGFYEPAFTGNFDGNGKTISNIEYDKRGLVEENSGLFGVTYQSTLSNLTVKNAVVKTNRDSFNSTGALVGYAAETVILNCTAADADIFGSTSGGLTGKLNRSVIMDSTVSGVVSSCSEGGCGGDQGGLSGVAEGSNFIRNVSSNVTITQNYECGSVGGLIGNYSYSDSLLVIKESSSGGDISAAGSAGGLIGTMVGGFGYISDSYSAGNIIEISDDCGSCSNQNFGGLVGAAEMSALFAANSYSLGDIGDKNAVSGGLFGYLSGSSATLMTTFSAGDLYASNSTGGLVG